MSELDFARTDEFWGETRHVDQDRREPERVAARRSVVSTTSAVLLVGDLVALVVALGVGVGSTRPGLLLAAGISVFVWAERGQYTERIRLSILEDLPTLALGVLAGIGLVTLMPGIAPPSTTAGLVLLAAVVVCRKVAYVVVGVLRSRGRLVRRVVLVASRSVAQDVRRRLDSTPERGIDLTSVLVSDEVSDGETFAGVVGWALHRTDAQVLMILDRGMPHVDQTRLQEVARRRGVRLVAAPGLVGSEVRRGVRDAAWGIPVQHPGARVFGPFERATKRLLDIVLAGTAMLLLSPLLLGTALAVRVSLGAGVLFRQERVGYDGRVFTMLKFRSLPTVSVDRAWGAAATAKISPVGRFIRRYSIDELPQLINVVKGDMSIVGPRPEQARFVGDLASQYAGYEFRHRAPVGLTGLAAVTGMRGNTSLEDRVYFDNLYIDNWSLWLDIKIIARTVGTVVQGSGR